MNYRLAREIYGQAPLMVDGATFSMLVNLVNDLRNGVKLEEKAGRLNSLSLYDLKSETLLVTDTYDLKSQSPESELVYVLNLNGPITKSGGMSSYGMKELADEMTKFDADSRVKGGVIITDSGGGSASGMEVMMHAISSLSKPLVALVERAGCACSAAYGIISATDYIFAESNESEVGSIGTMMSFAGYPDKATGSGGEVHATIYASASTKKNLWFEEAINNGNYKLAISEILDPFNERFLAAVSENRPGVKKTQLDGSVYNAGDVIGSLVDEIGDFEAAVNKVLELASIEPLSTITTSKKEDKKNTAMTKLELKAEHPALFAEIFGEGQTAGVAAEKSRTGVWLKHIAADQEAVLAGITGGAELSAESREELLIKGLSAKNLQNLKEDSAKNLNVAESKDETKVEPTEVQNFYAKVKEGIK